MSLLHRRNKDSYQNAEQTEPPITKSEPIDQYQSTSRVPRRRSSGLKFFATSTTSKPEASKDPHKAWEADYLMDLRANRPARPGGSRPLPGRAATSAQEPYARASSAMSFRPTISTQQPDPSADALQERSASALSHRRAQSYMPDSTDRLDWPMDRKPGAGVTSRDFSRSTVSSQLSSTIPNGTYRESGMRWMERQEARSLREALQDMDMRDEARVHADAQAEASDLVLKHTNKDTSSGYQYQPYKYKQHLEKGAHGRSQSIGWYASRGAARSDHVPGQQSISNFSASSNTAGKSSPRSRNQTTTFEETAKADHERDLGREQGHALWDSSKKKAYMNLQPTSLPLKASGCRRSSGPRARDVSGGLFRNPDDKIYEEPDGNPKSPGPVQSESSRIPAPLATKTRNTVSQMSTSGQPLSRSRVASAEDKQRVYRSEIYRNPPSQSRNPSYIKNEESSGPSDGSKSSELQDDLGAQESNNIKEIRSDEIRAATSMRLKDRSPKLPSPTVVSNRPGRPIVSFSQDWKPKDNNTQGDLSPTRPSGIPPRMRFKPQMPASTASAPIIPTINVPDPPSIRVNNASANEQFTMPSISVSDTSIPAITLPDEAPAARPLPTPSNRSRPSPANRPLPHHSSTTPVHSSKLHWSPSSHRATAQCAACALPIEGRIVSAASQRFHPHCFTCHHCAEPLECVAFYPEPDSARDTRLARIDARANGLSIPEEEEKPGETALDDGDASLRFYCHLDFHELFSPRCRSCKTPIETEVIVACGASWHVGHFFCAQCGDPFDAKTPFVEKDGYAWCVGCHAGRFSGKCKGCKKPVVDGGVIALGGEWHVECFCCVVGANALSDFEV